jgi:hypothetical protein
MSAPRTALPSWAEREPFGHPAFSDRALGKTACWLWGLLLDCPRSVAFLARVSGRDYRAVLGDLGRLQAVGLAELADDNGACDGRVVEGVVPRGWVRRVRDLDEVARELGVDAGGAT